MEGVVRLAHEAEVFIPIAVVEYMGALDPCPKGESEWKNCF